MACSKISSVSNSSLATKHKNDKKSPILDESGICLFLGYEEDALRIRSWCTFGKI